MEQHEEKSLKNYYANCILRNKFGLSSELANILSKFALNFYDKFFENFDAERVKHFKNASSNLCLSAHGSYTYKVEFYIGLMDKDSLTYNYSRETAIEYVFKTIGDCTILDSNGFYNGRQMKSFKVIKFFESKIPENFVHDKAKEFRNIFNQESIITEVSYNYKIDFNNYTPEIECTIKEIMNEYNISWDKAVDAYNSGLY